jgi:hypothetical protein
MKISQSTFWNWHYNVNDRVGTANRYGVEIQASNPSEGETFRDPSHLVIPKQKQPERGVEHPPPSNAELQMGCTNSFRLPLVDLYLPL